MFIRAYLRASTEDQFADRAKEMLEQFVQERGHKIASYYRENISGTKLDRPELGRLLIDSHRNDILLVEQIDRLTRLSNSDWMTLKKQIEQHECVFRSVRSRIGMELRSRIGTEVRSGFCLHSVNRDALTFPTAF
ncbi:recombinase family protein, partial [Serratia sp. N21D137]|uniref:recombinase family protein n=1 Tax=Serratia sp. N21D137 TaxID=3397495 RepID=UPI0039E1E838